MSDIDRRALVASPLLAVGGWAGSAMGNPRTQVMFNVPQSFIPVAGTDALFPVRRVYCIGRNYAAHALEMGGDPSREPPFFFQKPSDAVQYCPESSITGHPYPTLTHDYQHEVELVAMLHSGGRDIAVGDALRHVFGYAVGLDMTRRDLQVASRNEKKPWEIGKSFDRSAPIGPILPVARIGHLTSGEISLSVNGQIRQQANLSDMIWSVSEQIAHLSRSSELAAGDIIFSGTPANVGPVEIGDILVGKISGFPDLKLRITQPLQLSVGHHQTNVTGLTGEGR